MTRMASDTRLRAKPSITLTKRPRKVTMSHLSNPLATASQIYQVSSPHALPVELQDSIRFYTARLTQAAGILLRLPQDITAQANVLLFRYWLIDDLMAHEYSVGRFPHSSILTSQEAKLIEPGCLCGNHLPNGQSIRLTALSAQHYKRFRIPALCLFVPILRPGGCRSP